MLVPQRFARFLPRAYTASGRLLTGLLLGLLLGMLPVRATLAAAPLQQSQNTDSTYSIASTRYTYEWVTERAAWQQRDFSLETFFPFGVIVGNLRHQRRFGEREFSGTANYWVETWGDSYLHAHTTVAPNAITTTRFSVGGELYEVLGNWELSGWYEWRRYADTDVHVLGPQVGYYLGSWYLRLRTSATERNGTWGLMQMAAARYHLSTPDSFVEAQVGYGRSVELVAARSTGGMTLVESYFGSLRARRFFTQHLGASASITYNDTSFRRVGGGLGLLVRW